MAFNSLSQDVGLPSLDPPPVPQAQKGNDTLSKLPSLEVPEAKNLNDEERKVIDNVVDSLFEEAEKKENPAAVSINLDVDADENITVTAEKEVPTQPEDKVDSHAITDRSIIDSKDEIAEKTVQEVNDETSQKEQKAPQQVTDTNTKTEEKPKEKGSEPEVANNQPTQAEGQEKEDIKIFDTKNLFSKEEDIKDGQEAEISSTSASRFPAVKFVDKPIYISEPLETIEFQPLAVTQKSIISSSVSSASNGYNDESLYDSLEIIRSLPSKNKKVEVKEDIVIDRADFVDPFYEEVSSNEDANDELVNELDLSSIEKPLDIKELKESVSNPPKKAAKQKPKNFHMREKDLVVEVKSADNSDLKLRKNARDALSVGQYESAITYYKELMKNNPKDKKLAFGLATAYHKSKQYDPAKEYYLMAIKLDNNYWSAINNYIILVSEESPNNAEEKLKELWHKNPNFAAIPAQIGNINFKNRNYEKAEEYYAKAVSLDPTNYTYLYNMARIMEKRGNKVAAAKIYRRIIESPSQGSDLPESKINMQKRYYQLLANK